MRLPNPERRHDKEVLLRLIVAGQEVLCRSGQTVASALIMNGTYHLRDSPNARAPRGPFCMMGACQECAILIDSVIRRACQIQAVDGMHVELRGAGSDVIHANAEATTDNEADA